MSGNRIGAVGPVPRISLPEELLPFGGLQRHQLRAVQADDGGQAGRGQLDVLRRAHYVKTL
jgi:hypothetical protein